MRVMIGFFLATAILAVGCTRMRNYQSMSSKHKDRFERCHDIMSYDQRNEIVNAESSEEREKLLNRYCVPVGVSR